jgi:hypothetical protein
VTDTLFKIYDLEDYRQKAYSALPTTDNSLAGVYTIKVTVSLANDGKVKTD